MSEKLGLLHVSHGEGKERHLVVSKRGVKPVPTVEEETRGDASVQPPVEQVVTHDQPAEVTGWYPC